MIGLIFMLAIVGAIICLAVRGRSWVQGLDQQDDDNHDADETTNTIMIGPPDANTLPPTPPVLTSPIPTLPQTESVFEAIGWRLWADAKDVVAQADDGGDLPGELIWDITMVQFYTSASCDIHTRVNIITYDDDDDGSVEEFVESNHKSAGIEEEEVQKQPGQFATTSNAFYPNKYWNGRSNNQEDDGSSLFIGVIFKVPISV